MSKKEQEIKSQLAFASLFIVVAALLGSLLSKILSSDYFGNLVGEPSNMALILGAAIGVSGAVFAVRHGHTLEKKTELRGFATYLLADLMIVEVYLKHLPEEAKAIMQKTYAKQGITNLEVIAKSLEFMENSGIFVQFSQYSVDSVRLGQLPFSVVSRFGAIRIGMNQLSDISSILRANPPVGGKNGASETVITTENKMAASASGAVENILNQVTKVVDALADFANLSEKELEELRSRTATVARRTDF